MSDETIDLAQQRIGHVFADRALLTHALTHSSIAETRGASNERLEFLGDAVLGLICCQMLYEMYPDLLEGEMTKIKSSVVSRQTCARIARDLQIETLLVLGKGMKTQRSLPSSLAACAVEAVVAAVYLDGGLAAAEKLLKPILEPLIRAAAASGHQENFKSVLQQYSQQMGQPSPMYLVLDEKGPDHAKCFEVCAEMGSRRFPSVWANAKKQAEQQAALLALRELGLVRDTEGGIIATGNGGPGMPPAAESGND